MQKLLKTYLVTGFLLLWLVASSPFFSILAIAAHGEHETSLALHGREIEVAFHHGENTQSHSHEESHGKDHADHHVLVSALDTHSRLQSQSFLPEIIDLVVAPSFPFFRNNHIDFSEPSLIRHRLDRPPPSVATRSTTVLLI